MSSNSVRGTRCSCRPPLSADPCLALARLPDSARTQRRRLVPDGGSRPEPDSKNIPRGVHVAIVDYTAVRALPLSYNKLPYSCRAGEGSTVSAHLRGVSFIDHLELSRRLPTFICELSPEHTPTRIEHGFRHPCPGKLGRAHVADENLPVPAYEQG
jgi:hypothetical protein